MNMFGPPKVFNIFRLCPEGRIYGNIFSKLRLSLKNYVDFPKMFYVWESGFPSVLETGFVILELFRWSEWNLWRKDVSGSKNGIIKRKTKRMSFWLKFTIYVCRHTFFLERVESFKRFFMLSKILTSTIFWTVKRLIILFWVG